LKSFLEFVAFNIVIIRGQNAYLSAKSVEPRQIAGGEKMDREKETRK
jgi:hypothetical protein